MSERSIHQLELLLFHFRLAARSARAAQRIGATPLPCFVPTAHALATDLEFASDRRKDHFASSKQSGCAPPPMFHCLEIASGSTRGRHASILQQEESDCHCIMRTSVIVSQARRKRLLSDEHFTVDGTLVEAWAGQKSFQAKQEAAARKEPPAEGGGSNPTVNFRKEKRRNQTHESLTDPSARLFKKSRGAEARLGYLGHVITENRNGLVVDTRLTLATGTAERDAAAAMIEQKPAGKRVTLGGDRGYDTAGFVATMRGLRATPHVAQNTTNRRSAIDARTTRHEGYEESQRKRKRVEEVFGWLKTIALQRQTRFRGPERVGWMFTFAAAAYNLVRMRNLMAEPA